MAILLAELNDAELDLFLENFIDPDASPCATETAQLITTRVDSSSEAQASLWATLANFRVSVQGWPGSAGAQAGAHYHTQLGDKAEEPHRCRPPGM